MARTEARISCSIWSDRDFTALPIDAQWLYTLLLSQAAISHAGVLAMPRRMWANLTSDDDAEDRIHRARKILEDRAYIVIDDDSDELLVRTFIRNDKIVSGPPGTFRSAMRAAMAVVSPRLRAVLHAELLRLDREVIEGKGVKNGERPIDTYTRALAALDPGPNPGSARDAPTTPHGMTHGMKTGPEPGGFTPQSHAMSHATPHALGVGVGEVVNSPTRDGDLDAPPARTRAQARTRGAATAIDRAGPAHSPDAYRLVQAFAGTCNRRPPAKILSQLGVEVDALLTEDWPAELIADALTAWGSKGLGPGAFQSVANETANRRPAEPPAPRRARTTDDKRAAVQGIVDDLFRQSGGPTFNVIEGGAQA